MKMHKFLMMSALAFAMPAMAEVQTGNVPEPPRKDAKQQEIKEWFLENYYGRAPIGRPDDMEFKGNDILIAGGKVTIHLSVAVPPNASKENPCPVIIVADGRSTRPDPIPPDVLKRILADQEEFRRMAIERGYALVTWNVNEIAPDCWLYDRYIKMKPEELPPNAWGVFGLYGGEPDGRKGDTWGTVRAWAWGHSRVMDWIETRPEFDAKRVAVCGHSRLGKAALVAGVTDERFLVAYSNNSGVGGAHPHRLWKPGVCKLSYVNKYHLHWLCLNSRKFEADERNIPHDMDEFLALMAPRYLYVASASEDAWAGPEGEQFSAKMAACAWERMNLKGWGYRGHVGGHVRKGGHAFKPYDFSLFLDFCKTPLGTPVVEKKPAPVKGVRYRGIFINDEFYGLRPWAIRNFGLKEHIGTNAYKEVFSLMKREGLNLLWPAMHPCGAYPAYEYSKRPENLEQASEYGIAIGTSHCEPMLRNNAILSAKDKKKWNWTKHRKWLEDYWREGARRGAGKEILWTIGMRGISDSGLPDGKTLKDKVRILEDVFATQCAMLPKDAPKVFIPYKEAMNIYNAGLKVPDGATIMWANDNFGYVRRLGGPQAAGHGGGIYWHISYWGDPHSYYHVCTTPPAFMWYELVAKCWNNGVRDVWMVNAGDVFQAELMLKAYGKFANDPDAWGPDAQPRFLSGWAEEFLSGAAEIDAGARRTLLRRIAEHLAEYYNLGFNRKPEHMCIQWTKNLPADVKSGLLKRYHAFLAEEDAIEAALPASLREAYFRVVGYQARFLAHAGVIHLEGKGKKYAHEVIDPLTARWDAMEGGKWAGIWCDTIDGIDMLYKRNYNHSASIMQWPWNEPKDSKKKAARANYPATQYRADVPEPDWLEPVANKAAAGGAWTRVAGLGTSGNALALLPVKPGVGEGATAAYSLKGNEKTLVLQFLPDFALWPGLKLGVNVSFDGGKPVYVAVPESDSNIGEKNRLRNKAVQDNFIRVEIPVPQGAKKLEIIATDPGVVIDRVGVRL